MSPVASAKLNKKNPGAEESFSEREINDIRHLISPLPSSSFDALTGAVSPKNFYVGQLTRMIITTQTGATRGKKEKKILRSRPKQEFKTEFINSPRLHPDATKVGNIRKRKEESAHRSYDEGMSLRACDGGKLPIFFTHFFLSSMRTRENTAVSWHSLWGHQYLLFWPVIIIKRERKEKGRHFTVSPSEKILPPPPSE